MQHTESPHTHTHTRAQKFIHGLTDTSNLVEALVHCHFRRACTAASAALKALLWYIHTSLHATTQAYDFTYHKSYSHCMLRNALANWNSPSVLLTRHSYSPKSLIIVGSMLRLPSGPVWQRRIRSCTSSSGVPSLNQPMVDVSGYFITQWKNAVWPSIIVWFTGGIFMSDPPVCVRKQKIKRSKVNCVSSEWGNGCWHMLNI